MKIQFYNRFDNTFRFLSVIIVVLLAAFLIAPNALAGQCFDKDGNLKPHAKPSCSTPNPFPPGESFNQAMFDDAYIAVDPQAFTRANPNFDRGDYLADNPESAGVLISSNSLSKVTLKGKRDSDLCHVLDQRGGDDPFFGYPDTFSYGWTDDCRDTECDVEVSLSFEGDLIIDLTDGRSDRLEMVMFATAAGLEQGQFEPFTTPQALAINSIEIEYNKAGTTRALVQCRLGPQGRSGPKFHTEPTP
jgi:hypothetical protein